MQAESSSDATIGTRHHQLYGRCTQLHLRMRHGGQTSARAHPKVDAELIEPALPQCRHQWYTAREQRGPRSCRTFGLISRLIKQ